MEALFFFLVIARLKYIFWAWLTKNLYLALLRTESNRVLYSSPVAQMPQFLCLRNNRLCCEVVQGPLRAWIGLFMQDEEKSWIRDWSKSLQQQWWLQRVLTLDPEVGIQRQLWGRSKNKIKKERQLLGRGGEGLEMFGRVWNGRKSGFLGWGSAKEKEKRFESNPRPSSTVHTQQEITERSNVSGFV